MINKIKTILGSEARQKFWMAVLGTKRVHPTDYYIVVYWALGFFFAGEYMYRHYWKSPNTNETKE